MGKYILKYDLVTNLFCVPQYPQIHVPAHLFILCSVTLYVVIVGIKDQQKFKLALGPQNVIHFSHHVTFFSLTITKSLITFYKDTVP